MILVNYIIFFLGDSAIGYLGSLPYRRVTVRDAIEDLPYTDYDIMTSEMPYTKKENISFYARQLRDCCNADNIVTDHECNSASAIVKKRIEYIPKGGDWTDLPNVVTTLEDGTKLGILPYIYR